MLAPYPANRLHNQHPPPPAPIQSGQPIRSILRGVNFRRRSPNLGGQFCTPKHNLLAFLERCGGFDEEDLGTILLTDIFETDHGHTGFEKTTQSLSHVSEQLKSAAKPQAATNLCLLCKYNRFRPPTSSRLRAQCGRSSEYLIRLKTDIVTNECDH